MKKIIALLLAALMVVAFAACTTAPVSETESDTAKPTETDTETETEAGEDDGVMSYAEFAALDVSEGNKEVVIEAYVQDKESYYQEKASLYAQDKDGAYFIYKASLTQEQYDALTPGTKIKVTGEKTVWSGFYEIAEGATVEIIEGGDTFVAEAVDATAILGNEEELAKIMSTKVAFKGLTVAAKDENGTPIFYGWDNSGSADSDSDVYFDAEIAGNKTTFVIAYWQASAEGARETAKTLKVGDKIDVEGFLYWYNGPQTHVTGITIAD